MSRMIRRATFVLMTLTAGSMCGCGMTEIWNNIQIGALGAVQEAAAARVAGWIAALSAALPII